MTISNFGTGFLRTSFLVIVIFGGSYGQNTASISVSAFDRNLDPITSLNKENFVLKENGKRKDIIEVSHGDEPTTFAILFDVSGSMAYKPLSTSANRVEVYRTVIAKFIQERRRDDEYFVMAFAEAVKSITGFVGPEAALKAIDDEMHFQKPEKNANTNLFGSLLHASEKLLKSGRNQRKAVILLSDGVDNASTNAQKRDVKRIFEKEAITVFHLSMPSEISWLTYEGLNTMKSLTDRTGGAGWLILRKTDLEVAKKGLSDHLKTQYRLTYMPSGQDASSREVKNRKIDVSLDLPREERNKIGRSTLFYRSIIEPIKGAKSSN